MQALSGVSLTDFEAALTPAEVRTSQIIQGAIGIGIALFIVVVYVMYVTIEAPVNASPPNASIVQIMSLIHLLLAASLVITAQVVYGMQFSPERLKQVFTQDESMNLEPPQRCISLIRTAMIIRLGLYEGIALFGLIVCLLAVVDHVVQVYPMYWLNMLSTLLVLSYVVVTLPTGPRIKKIFIERIKRGDVS